MLAKGIWPLFRGQWSAFGDYFFSRRMKCLQLCSWNINPIVLSGRLEMRDQRLGDQLGGHCRNFGNK